MARTPTLKARSRFKERLLFGFILTPLRLFCDACGRYVPSDMAWHCSYCNQANNFTKVYSFLHKCKHCKQSPKSYICPHCEKTNFLDKRRDGRHPAKHTNSPKVLQEDEQERKRRLHEERKTELERELIIARLSANLESILTPRDPIASKVLKIRDEIRGMLMTEIEINLLEREFEKKIEEGNWSAAQKRDIQARLKELLIQVRDNL